MKFNKTILGLGALAMAFTSCSDDVEYTPAPAVVNPPAYFSSLEETVFDLEESDTQVDFKLYRANTDAEADVPVQINLSAEDGSSANGYFEGFKEGANTVMAHFEAGSALATIPVNFVATQLAPTVNYIFDCKVEGEDSPYFVTSATYDLSFTPWETVPDCQIFDNAAMAPFGGEKFIWAVTVQEHPLKPGFFRVRAPYADCEEYFAMYYNLPESDPNYLYINATTPNEAYFSDSKGNPVITYNTGVFCQAGQGFQETYGYIELKCLYSAYLLKENIPNGSSELSYEDFGTAAGVYTINEELGTRKVKFNGCLFSYLAGYGAGTYGDEWELWLNGADDNEDWAELGMAEYTDGFIAPAYQGMTLETYDVPVQKSLKTEGLYRLVRPYSSYWPYGDDSEGDFFMEIDCSDPDFVVIPRQTVLVDAYGTYQVLNAATCYLDGIFQSTPVSTKNQIINMGLNDKMENGVITINHPAFLDLDAGSGFLYWLSQPDVKAVIKLPGEGAAAAPAKATTTKSSKKSDTPKVARIRSNQTKGFAVKSK